MRSTAAVDDLILWLGAGILGLAWLTMALVTMDGLLAKPEYTEYLAAFDRVGDDHHHHAAANAHISPP
jgi:hypothetical protein